MSLSADGYIAGPDGSFDWAVPSEELHRFHNERVAEIWRPLEKVVFSDLLDDSPICIKLMR